MQGFYHSDTVVAISTPFAPAGLGVVRLSGKAAREIADKVFNAANRKRIANAQGYSALYGKVYDGDGLIDEAVALIFAAPRSYTGEDVVEISCHGGIYLLKRVLRALTDAGARLASPGEFTRRAFMNGKMDLTSAEAVMNLIEAEDKTAHTAALAGRNGVLYRDIQKAKDALIKSAAALAAWTDFPDDDIPQVSEEALEAELSASETLLQQLLDTFEQGRLLRDGIDTVIAGKPNVGKSTLMNMMSGTTRSIVTSLPGTTRDVIEETVVVGDVKLRLADTAGLRMTDDPVERIGVGMANERLDSASLILAVFSGSEPLDEEDFRLIKLAVKRPVVGIINKTDLCKKADIDYIKQNIEHTVEISALTGSGAEQLSEVIRAVTGLCRLDPSSAVIANERQRECVSKAVSAVNAALSALAEGFTLDAVGVCIDDAISALLGLSGEKVSDTVVDEVFAHFCVGK